MNIIRRILSRIVSYQVRRELEIFNDSLLVVGKTVQHRRESVETDLPDVYTHVGKDHTRTVFAVFYLPIFRFGETTNPTSFENERGWKVLRVRVSHERPFNQRPFWRLMSVWANLGPQKRQPYDEDARA